MSLIIEETATGFRMSRINTKDQDRIADQEILPREIQLPEEVNKEPLQEEGSSGILEENPDGLDTSLDVSDNSELVKKKELEPQQHDMSVQSNTKVENATSGTSEIVLPEGVVAPPRNEEEIHLDLLKGNLKGITTYLTVSDDNGELLGDKDLEQQIKTEFCIPGSNSAVNDSRSPEEKIEHKTKLLQNYQQKINATESGCSGIFCKYRIRLGMGFSDLKSDIKNADMKWLDYYNSHFNPRELRSVQNHMNLGEIPNSLRFAFLGSERLLETTRLFSKEDEKTEDPFGAFFSRNGIDFDPQVEVGIEDLKLKTDIAINHQRLLKADLEIPMEQIELFVRQGCSVEQKLIKELETRKDAGQDLNEAFKAAIAKKGKVEPIRTPERDADGVNNSTARLINAITVAMKQPRSIEFLKTSEIDKLKDMLLSFEQWFLTNTQESQEVTVESVELPQDQEGGN